MFITERKLKEALEALQSGESRCDLERYENGSLPVQLSYLMDWYQVFFRDISDGEMEEAEDVKKATWRRFTESDWDYVIRNANGVYSFRLLGMIA
ncbi:MAG: hypothetical protein IJT92_04640 [Spirochaetia bacterium]|nr:hypothetical protein [Spirochaetia bacterium]